MPNWAYQEIHCKNKEDLEKIRNAFSEDPSDDYADIDFNKIIPMPKSIKLTSSPSDFKAAAFFLMPDEILPLEEIKLKIDEFVKTLKNPIYKTLNNMTIKDLIDIKADKRHKEIILSRINEPDHEIIENQFRRYCKEFNLEPTIENYGKQMLYNYMMYGMCDWYDWSRDNWDTKWNASDTVWSERSVYFRTAWNPSEKIPMEISKQLNIPLFVEYAEEQLTEYGGTFEIENGEIIDEEYYDAGSKEIFIVAARLDDPNQQSMRYDENNQNFVFEWDLDDINSDSPYESIEDIPEIDLTLEKLEKFKNS